MSSKCDDLIDKLINFFEIFFSKFLFCLELNSGASIVAGFTIFFYVYLEIVAVCQWIETVVLKTGSKEPDTKVISKFFLPIIYLKTICKSKF